MSSPRAKPVLGLIGAIGAGKSTVASLLAERGGKVVDADKLGHAALERPDVKASLVDRLGQRILKPDGTVNRRAVGGIVFSDPAERQVLESVVFPVIGVMTAERIASAANETDTKFVVLDAAVLLEGGWAGACDRILFVDAPQGQRLARTAARSKWTAADLAAREAAQMPAQEKMAKAHAVIVNDGTVAELRVKLDALLQGWGWV